MVDFTERVGGVAVWIWIFLVGSLISLIAVLVYIYREKVQKKIYEIRFPERLFKVVIHYDTKQYREYWRLIPDAKTFKIGEKEYEYTDKALVKENELFTYDHTGKTYFKLQGKAYEILNKQFIKKRKSIYPELHYFYNIPTPIQFDYKAKQIDFTGSQLHDFKENDLFTKLLTLRDQQKLLNMLVLLIILNIAATAFVILRMFEIV